MQFRVVPYHFDEGRSVDSLRKVKAACHGVVQQHNLVFVEHLVAVEIVLREESVARKVTLKTRGRGGDE